MLQNSGTSRQLPKTSVNPLISVSDPDPDPYHLVDPDPDPYQETIDMDPGSVKN